MKKQTGQESNVNIELKAKSPLDGGMNIKMGRPRLLLHSCCGPCSTAVIERLIDNYDITVFFYNPNITEKEEYDLRLDAQKTVLDGFNNGNKFIIDKIGLIKGEYVPETFLERVKGLEKEPEGGKRCDVCFNMRLEETARYAKCNGYDVFGTTLTVSPHKNYNIISKIGKSLGEKYGVEYLDMDFKKQRGFQRSVELSKEFGLYRQNYCGCRFSQWFGATGDKF